MNQKNLEKCEIFSFLNGGIKRCLDVSNVILLKK